MFSSKGLFKGVPCPNPNDCTLPACWFLHRDATTPDGNSAQEYDPFSAGAPESPPAKRRKLSHSDESHHDISLGTPVTFEIPESHRPSAKPSATATKSASAEQPAAKEDKEYVAFNKSSGGSQIRTASRQVTPPPSQSSAKKSASSHPPKSDQAVQRTTSLLVNPNGVNLTVSKSLERPVSPPATKPKAQNGPQTPTGTAKPAQPIKKEPLIPRSLGPGPAQVSSRINFLKAIHMQIKAKNSEVLKAGTTHKAVRLTEQEMITLALDEEEFIAKKHGTGIYQNIIRQRVHAIKTMKLEDWAVFITDKVPRVQRLTGKTAPQVVQEAKERSTGMTAEEELAVLRRLHEPLDDLEQYGYVAKRPSDAEAAAAKDAVKASGNSEQCERCGSRFQVFPGRDEEGRLASGGKCVYHWARAGSRPQTRAERSAGPREDKYGCCNQPFGSDGCTEAHGHVFNVKDRKRLASIWQWEHTPDKEGTRQPLSFDCEMCYTTLGMEVVRVTAVSWPHNEPVLDVLVRPFGEILDLNTRFSGVSRKIYTEATTYNSETSTKALQKVGSPADARQLLFDLITPRTPLIGHAIDNDLNTLRIIHPLVIDTVLLYPHRLGLPRRMNLRGLARDHLSRTIQSGEGHDSKEDAIATGDLVTLAVKSHRVVLRVSGWKLENGEFVKGEGSSKL